MHDQKISVVLSGGRRKFTGVLGRHAFVGGRCDLYLGPENMTAALTYLARSYQAYPEGSPEALAALERDKANGLLGDLQANPAKTDGAPTPVQSAGDHDAGSLSGARALHGEVDASGSPGSEGLVPGGAGHENAGLGERVEPQQNSESVTLIRLVQQAVQKLDPTVDDQWSEGGLPSVDYLAAALQNPGVTRELIELAVPGWNRHKAEDLAAL